MLAVAPASACACLFRFLARDIIEGFNKFGNLVNIGTAVSSILLQLLVVSAFIMSAKALSQYDEDAGGAAVIITSIIGGILVLFWLGMAMCEDLGMHSENDTLTGQ